MTVVWSDLQHQDTCIYLDNWRKCVFRWKASTLYIIINMEKSIVQYAHNKVPCIFLLFPVVLALLDGDMSDGYLSGYLPNLGSEWPVSRHARFTVKWKIFITFCYDRKVGQFDQWICAYVEFSLVSPKAVLLGCCYTKFNLKIRGKYLGWSRLISA